MIKLAPCRLLVAACLALVAQAALPQLPSYTGGAYGNAAFAHDARYRWAVGVSWLALQDQRQNYQKSASIHLFVAVIARTHAFQFLEEVAEVKLAGKVHLLSDLLDVQPRIRKQQLRLFQPPALDKTVDILLQHREKQRSQPGVTDAGNARQVLHSPVVEGLGFYRVEDPDHGRGKFGGGG
jgi:hypothetical protein